MKKWQEERNYRRIYNEAGEVIANIITVDGVDVEVAEDVYLAYSQADRRERYVREEQFSGKILSLEQMAEDDLLSDYVGAEAAPSAEEEALEREQAQSLAERKEMLLLAMLSLNDCCPQPISECEPSDCPVEVDWLRFRRVVSYITVASDATVSLTFTDDNFTGKDK